MRLDKGLSRLGVFILVAIILLVSAMSLLLSPPQSRLTDSAESSSAIATHDLAVRYQHLVYAISRLESSETSLNVRVVQDSVLEASLTRIRLDTATENIHLARSEAMRLNSQLIDWQAQAFMLAQESSPANSISAAINLPLLRPTNRIFIPILIYHKTPTDFGQQLTTLKQRGYTTVSLEQVAASFAHQMTLPKKPIVLTFDDGFADQMRAFNLLQQYRMKATFYIIVGGSASNWCIGASRRYNDPAQPAGGCGDAYLSWDQIRQVDHSGLITIGGHTLNHLNLTQYSITVQRHEIIDGKASIEQEIGHPIYDFAYPYGSFNANTIKLVQEAGYDTAVTTNPGTYQSPSTLYTMPRIRSTLDLP